MNIQARVNETPIAAEAAHGDDATFDARKGINERGTL